MSDVTAPPFAAEAAATLFRSDGAGAETGLGPGHVLEINVNLKYGK
jgi:hypothetical protein